MMKEKKNVKVFLDGVYKSESEPVLRYLNTEDTEWCCTGLKNSDEGIQFNYDKYKFETGGVLDLGMGGFGNRLTDTHFLDECPFCGASLKKVDVVQRGYKSINEAYKNAHIKHGTNRK